MWNEILPGEEILELQKEKGKVCITIIIPTHRLSPERRIDRLSLSRAIEQAIDQLRDHYSSELITRTLSTSLKQCAEEIDLIHNTEGLGIYVSAGIRKIVRFAFPVIGKIVISDQFDLRDLWYKHQLSAAYHVLMISENKVSYYQGRMNELEEVFDNEIPHAYEEEYIYELPSRSTSYAGHAHVKSFENDRTVIEEYRMKDFLRKIDKGFRKYVIGEEAIVLLAPEKTISWYKDVAHLKNHVLLTKEGGFSHTTISELQLIVWPLIYHHYLQQFEQERINANEMAGHHRAVFGLEECWRAAVDGNAYKLLIEKDYRQSGYISSNGRLLHLNPPSTVYVSYGDVVEELIELVRSKKGKILYGENNSLSHVGKVALLTRY
jgi:hypothetical protein